MSRILLAIGLLAVTTAGTLAQDQLPKALSKEVLEAWEKAGAANYWGKLSLTPSLGFSQNFDTNVLVKQPMAGWLPTLYFSGSKWNAGRLPSLPEPECPFAIMFYDVRLTAADFRSLAKYKNLIWLELHGCERLKPDCFRELKPLSSLRYLGLDDTTFVTNDSLRAICELSQLTALKVQDKINLTDASFASFSKLENLVSLNAAENDIGPRGMVAISKLHNLRHLSFANTRYTDAAGLKLIATLPKLKDLNLSGLKIPMTDDSAKILGGMKSLTWLEVTFTGLNDKHFAALTDLQQLEWLDVGLNDELTDLTNIKKLQRLRHLNAMNTKVTDRGARELGELPELRTLNLGSTHISDEGLKAIAKATSLTELYLSGSKATITDTGLLELASLKKLQKLNIGYNQVTAKGVAELQKALPMCKIDNSR